MFNFRSKRRHDLRCDDSILDHLLTFRAKSDRRYKFRIFAIRIFFIIVNLCLPLHGLIRLALCVLSWIFVSIFLDHSVIYSFDPVIRVWFGVPGAGKTSMAALLAKHSIDRSIPVLSNVNIAGSYKLEPSDLGKYDMSFDDLGAHVILDEGSLIFDNRNYQEFAKTKLPHYFSLHRHMTNQVDVFSQGYDIDKRIRDRAGAAGLYYLKKLPFPGYLMYRNIKRVLFIKKDDKQMIDGFEFRGLPHIIRSKSVWGSFDTLDKSLCPKEQKQWEYWTTAEE